MPAKSAKQYGIMAATMGGSPTGIPKKVASEFVHKTPASKRKAFAAHLTGKKKDKKNKKNY